MNKWNLVIDISLCTNCQNCVIATQDEYMGNEFPGYSKPGAPTVKTLDIDRHVRGGGSTVDVQCVPRMCNNCDDAPCVAASGGAIRKRPDGIVLIDPGKAAGRRDLVDTCPYGMIVWNEQEDVPQSWNFDAHLLDSKWDQPRAAQACPTDAIKALKVSDQEMKDLARKEGLEVLPSDSPARPRVYYKNLAPYLTQFIGGNVSAKRGGQPENIADAHVTLLQEDKVVIQTRTDEFGDFKFDGLSPESGNYHIRVSHPEYGEKDAKVKGPLARSEVVNVTLS